MDLVYECFVKLGLRYVCVTREGRFAGLVSTCDDRLWQLTDILSRRIRKRLSSTCGNWKKRRGMFEWDIGIGISVLHSEGLVCYTGTF